MSRLEDDPVTAAEELGLVCVTPQPNELFIDVDSEESYQRYIKASQCLSSNNFQVDLVRATPSKSGGPHMHIVLRVTATYSLTDMERILLQACLGSDPIREILSYLRIKYGSPYPPTTFFESSLPKKSLLKLEDLNVGF